MNPVEFAGAFVAEFFKTIINFEWLENVIYVVFWVIMKVVGLILLPFNLILQSFFPDLGGFDKNIESFFVLVNQHITWLSDLTLIPNTGWRILTLYLIFNFMISWVVWFGKLMLKWKGLFR